MMTRAEMIEAVNSLLQVQGSEEEQSDTLFRLKECLPGAMISDLIFYPECERTTEEIVDEALRRVKAHPIHLGYSPSRDGS